VAAQADEPMPDADAPGAASADAARAIYRAFVAKFGAPKKEVAQDLLEAYIEEAVIALAGEPAGDKDLTELRGAYTSALQAVEKIAAQAVLGADGRPLEGGSTGPSPSDNKLGLYKDFKKFLLERAQAGPQSQDRSKILFLEAQISELHGYLQSNSIVRTRLIEKINARFLKDANGEAAMKKRLSDWRRKVNDVRTLEAQLKDVRDKLGKARVAESMLREKRCEDKKLMKKMEEDEDAAINKIKEETIRKAAEQKERLAKKEEKENQKIAAAAAAGQDKLKYKGKHNHSPEVLAALAEEAEVARKKKRRNIFIDDEAEEAAEDEEDPYA